MSERDRFVMFKWAQSAYVAKEARAAFGLITIRMVSVVPV